MRDLADLASLLDPNKTWNWIFPQGPHQVPLGPHGMGYAWFPLRMADLDVAGLDVSGAGWAKVQPPGMNDACARVLSFIDSLHLNPKDTVVGGFSQGAMVSSQCVCESKVGFRGLLALSGSLVNEKVWRSSAINQKNWPAFFQSHGREDMVLPVGSGRLLNRFLTDVGARGQFMEFQGGHEIPYPVIEQAAHFLSLL